jgi:protein-disulfide isomerase
VPVPRFVYKVELGASPARGDADALITVVAFSSYACPRCREVEASLQTLAREVGPLRLVWKDLPNADGAAAALAGRAAAAQGRFWELHDRLVGASAPLDEGALDKAAASAGIDGTRFAAARADEAMRRELEVDAAEARRFGLTRAPAIFINGRYVPDPTLANLRQQLDDSLAFAHQLVTDGTPAGKVYSALMRGALPHAGPVAGASDLAESLQ